MIEVQGLTKRYGPFTAVHDLSFSVASGEILGFLGPERSREDHDHAGAHRILPPRARASHASPDTDRSSTEPLAAKAKTGYLPESPPAVPGDDGAGLRRLRGPAASARLRSPGRRASTPCSRALCARETSGTSPTVEAVEGLPPARRARPSARPRSRRARARRADGRARPEADRRDAGAHPRPRAATTRSSSRPHILPEVSMTCDRVVILYDGRLVAPRNPGRAAGAVRRDRRGPRKPSRGAKDGRLPARSATSRASRASRSCRRRLRAAPRCRSAWRSSPAIDAPRRDRRPPRRRGVSTCSSCARRG